MNHKKLENILLYVLDRSQMKLLAVVGRTETKFTSIPGTIASYPDQQRITSTFAGRSYGTDFKGICAQFLHIIPLLFRLS